MPEEPQQTNTNTEPNDSVSIMTEIADKIADAHNILIALSSDPSVDELAAAIGLSICLDRAGKRATAIYSGSTPNALEFLKPEDTFEATADTLQDFVIAINKDKADHLRYKLDGDYVRIYITPYKTRIDEDDLDFSYGDFNIDLVLALDVSSGTDLDAALREHGRIMHDASIINITTGNPGKFGEIEWSDKSRSSISEMVATLLYGIKKLPVEKDEATALLTGIVAATSKFSNASTTAETMQIAAKLMESGANQQLISENITADMDNQMFSFNKNLASEHSEESASLDIEHGPEADESSAENDKTAESDDTAGTATPADESIATNTTSPAPAAVGVTLAPSSPDLATSSSSPEISSNFTQEVGTTSAAPVSLAPSPELGNVLRPAEKIVSPSADFLASPSDSSTNKYSQMIDEALAEDAAMTTPLATPVTSAPGVSDGAQTTFSTPAAFPNTPSPISSVPSPMSAPTGANINPAANLAPSTPAAPEINGVPEINYNLMPDADILPPPPTPPIDLDTTSMPPMPSGGSLSGAPQATTNNVPPASPMTSGNPSSAASDTQAPAAPATDSSAFQIPTQQNS